MLLDQMMSVIDKLVGEIKEADQEKRDHFVKSAVALFEIATEALRTSPEFRRGFLKAHVEFLDHPGESRVMIEKSIEAYRRFTGNN